MRPRLLVEVEDCEAHLRASIYRRKPAETMQQTAIAMLDGVSAPAREQVLRALLGTKARCSRCSQTARIQRIVYDYDLQLWCETSSCIKYNRSFLDIELKPNRAPAHPSLVNCHELQARVAQGVVVADDGYEIQPGLCGKPICDCRIRLAQIAAHKRPNVPALFLTDHTRTASQVYGADKKHFRIVGIRERRIAEGLLTIASRIDLQAMSQDDSRLVRLAATALWMRVPAFDFRTLTTNTQFQRFVVDDLLKEAKNSLTLVPR